MADSVFTPLNEQVTNLEGVVPSVVAIINGIAKIVADAVEADNLADTTQSAGLADRIRAQADALAAAAAANSGTLPA
jgi:pseudouridine-5'-phosphate glycosidase